MPTPPWFLLVLLLGLCQAGCLAAQSTVSYRNGEVRVVPAGTGTELAVYRGESTVAILGRRSVSGDTLIFRPLVDFAPGQTYRVRIDGEGSFRFQVPRPADYEPARILDSYPGVDTVPSNLLKFHLQFSRPMRGGNVYPHLALVGPRGDTIERAILPLEPPLWNDDRTALTLWLEPGRIKRDLGPNQRLGPILRFGQAYRLSVARELRDADGLPLAEAYTLAFIAGARDTLRPDPGEWHVYPPEAGTRQVLPLETGEALDWATATSYLQVHTAAGTAVAGTWRLATGDRRIEFTPSHPWQAGDYRLVIDIRLEDLAGNNLERLFDRPVDRAPDASPLISYLPFRIR